MKRIALLLVLVPSLASADKTYNDAGAKIAHDCDKDGNAVLNGAAASGSITGKCDKISITGSTAKLTIASVAKLSVTGSMNEITVDAVDKLSVTGSKNTVSWKKSVSGEKPKISQTGVGNKIKQEK
jgi:hypothetical protein